MDLATLGIVVDASQVPQAASSLDQLTAAGKRAEESVGGVGRGAKSASVAAAEYVAKVQASARETNAYSTSATGAATASAAALVQTEAFTVGIAAQEAATIAAREATQALAAVMSGALTAGITVVIALVGSLIGRLFTSADASDTAAKHADNYTDALGRQLGRLEDVIRSEQRLAAIRSANAKANADLKAQDAANASAALRTAQASLATNQQLFLPGEGHNGGALTKSYADLKVKADAAKKAQEELTQAQVKARVSQLALVEIVAKSGTAHAHLQNRIDKLREGVARGTVAWDEGVKEIIQTQRQMDALDKTTDHADSTVRKATASHRDHTKAVREHVVAVNQEADALAKLRQRMENLWNAPAEFTDDFDKFMRGPTKLQGPNLEDLLPKMNQDDLLAAPNALLDALKAISDQSQTTAQVMQDAFGNVGGVFGGLIANIADYNTAQQQLAVEVLKGSKTQAEADNILHAMRAKNTAAALSGLKSLFKEHSTGYKVMTAIEKAYAIFQAVQTAIAIARDIAHTASTLANSAFARRRIPQRAGQRFSLSSACGRSPSSRRWSRFSLPWAQRAAAEVAARPFPTSMTCRRVRAREPCSAIPRPRARASSTAWRSSRPTPTRIWNTPTTCCALCATSMWAFPSWPARSPRRFRSAICSTRRASSSARAGPPASSASAPRASNARSPTRASSYPGRR
jgi:hypothetical protein